MVQLTCEIISTHFNIKSVVDIEIDSSYLNLTDQVKIIMPRTNKLIYLFEVGSNFYRGYPIEIKLGYDFNNQMIFVGYIEELKVDKNVEIICTDSYPLKLKKNIKTIRQAKLAKVIEEIIPTGDYILAAKVREHVRKYNSYPTKFKLFENEVLDADLGNYRIDKLSSLQVLDDLKKNYGILTWIRDRKIYTGLAFWPELQKEYKIYLNGPDSLIIKSDLYYKNEDEILISCKATSILPDNKKIEVEIGDKEGESRTLHFFNITDKATLQRLAEDKLKEFKYSGFRGSFTTFGFDKYNHGDIIEIIDTKYKEKTGKYIIEKVVTNFSQSGYRQTVYISSKVE